MDWMEFGGSIWFDPSRENRGFGGFSFDAHSTLLYPIFFFLRPIYSINVAKELTKTKTKTKIRRCDVMRCEAMN